MNICLHVGDTKAHGLMHMTLMPELSARYRVKITVILLGMLSAFCVSAQQAGVMKADTLLFFHGTTKVLLPEGTSRLKRRMVKEFSAQYGVDQVHCASGFTHQERKYGFFHTSLQYPAVDDGGISMWETIIQVAGSVKNKEFLRSGWEIIDDRYLCFIDLKISGGLREKFLRMVFFKLRDKIAIVMYECPMDDQDNTEQHLFEAPKFIAFRNVSTFQRGLSARRAGRLMIN